MLSILVFIGGGLGSALRLAASRLAGALPPASFPTADSDGQRRWRPSDRRIGGLVSRRGGTLASPAQPASCSPACSAGFTTFSAFSLEAVTLWQRGAPGAAALYVLASVGLSLAATIAGLAVVPGLGMSWS